MVHQLTGWLTKIMVFIYRSSCRHCKPDIWWVRASQFVVVMCTVSTLVNRACCVWCGPLSVLILDLIAGAKRMLLSSASERRKRRRVSLVLATGFRCRVNFDVIRGWLWQKCTCVKPVSCDIRTGNCKKRSCGRGCLPSAGIYHNTTRPALH